MYMERKTKREGASSGAWRLTKMFVGFFALFAGHFSLLTQRVTERGARPSTPTLATVLTALTIHLI